MQTLPLLVVLMLAVSAQAPQTPQSAPAAPKQQLPSKDDPQGYSKEMFEEPKEGNTLHHPPSGLQAERGAEVAPLPDGLAEVVKAQFGEHFELALQRTTRTVRYLKPQAGPRWVAFLAADLDGDGSEDAIIVTRSTNPMMDQNEHSYKVIDPYFTYHGYGDPKITFQQKSDDPDRGHIVLIIHGSGAEGWRAAQPKAKFAVINLPFDTLDRMKLDKKYKGRDGLALLSSDEQHSVLAWDGKKYVWRELGSVGP